MKFLNNFLAGNTYLRYIESGFTEEEARAMAWIAQQKAKGKFWGATVGLFMAFSWGHWHSRITQVLGVSFSPRLTQLGMIMGSILLFDYIYTGSRKGANEYVANNLLMNNNLLTANVNSLIDNFDIFTRKFSPEQIEALNLRRNLLKTNHHSLQNKKWIYNKELYTPEQFAERVKSATQAPWSDKAIKPVNIASLIDLNGNKLGINQTYTFGWSPLH